MVWFLSKYLYDFNLEIENEILHPDIHSLMNMQKLNPKNIKRHSYKNTSTSSSFS